MAARKRIVAFCDLSRALRSLAEPASPSVGALPLPHGLARAATSQRRIAAGRPGAPRLPGISPPELPARRFSAASGDAEGGPRRGEAGQGDPAGAGGPGAGPRASQVARGRRQGPRGGRGGDWSLTQRITSPREGAEILRHMLATGHAARVPDVVAAMEGDGVPVPREGYAALMRAHNDRKRPYMAVEAFRRMRRRGIAPDAATFEALLYALGKMGRFEELLAALDEMCEHARPDALTYAMVVLAIAETRGDWDAVRRVEEHMRETGAARDENFLASLVRMYRWPVPGEPWAHNRQRILELVEEARGAPNQGRLASGRAVRAPAGADAEGATSYVALLSAAEELARAGDKAAVDALVEASAALETAAGGPMMTSRVLATACLARLVRARVALHNLRLGRVSDLSRAGEPPAGHAAAGGWGPQAVLGPTEWGALGPAGLPGWPPHARDAAERERARGAVRPAAEAGRRGRGRGEGPRGPGVAQGPDTGGAGPGPQGGAARVRAWLRGLVRSGEERGTEDLSRDEATWNLGRKVRDESVLEARRGRGGEGAGRGAGGWWGGDAAMAAAVDAAEEALLREAADALDGVAREWQEAADILLEAVRQAGPDEPRGASVADLSTYLLAGAVDLGLDCAAWGLLDGGAGPEAPGEGAPGDGARADARAAQMRASLEELLAFARGRTDFALDFAMATSLLSKAAWYAPLGVACGVFELLAGGGRTGLGTTPQAVVALRRRLREEDPGNPLRRRVHDYLMVQIAGRPKAGPMTRPMGLDARGRGAGSRAGAAPAGDEPAERPGERGWAAAARGLRAEAMTRR